jgi:hypothetical protein
MKIARRMRHPMQDYYNRNYIGGLVDEQWFDIQNTGCLEGPFFCHAIGCLDALDNIPAGSMVSIAGGWYDASFCERGTTLAEIEEREEFIQKLFNEMR